MARLYLDEDVHAGLAGKLRDKGHDVQTSNQAGNSNRRFPDDKQLAHAADNDRIILTNNRRDFNKEHIASPGHQGIISGYHDRDLDRFAGYVDTLVRNNNLANVNIRANVNEFVVENKAGSLRTYSYDQPKIDPAHIQPHQPQPGKSALDTVLTALRPPAAQSSPPWEAGATPIADRLRVLDQRAAPPKTDPAPPSPDPAPSSKPRPASSPSPG